MRKVLILEGTIKQGSGIAHDMQRKEGWKAMKSRIKLNARKEKAKDPEVSKY